MNNSCCFKNKNEKPELSSSKSNNEANVTASENNLRSIAFFAEKQNLDVTASKNMILNVVFCADFGCTKFMINNCKYFTSCRHLKERISITS